MPMPAALAGIDFYNTFYSAGLGNSASYSAR
jgi:hypothetical protein